MTDTPEEILRRARAFQDKADAEGYGRPKNTLGSAVGKVLVKSLDYAYTNGYTDARVEAEKAIASLPFRMRQGVELLERGAVLRILHEMRSPFDPAD